MSSPATPRNNEVTPGAPSSLKDVLRRRQQGRISSSRSCLPCRERKVKCDHELPCATCNRRGHPDLCSYPGSGGERSNASPNARRSISRRTTPSAEAPGGGAISFGNANLPLANAIGEDGSVPGGVGQAAPSLSLTQDAGPGDLRIDAPTSPIREDLSSSRSDNPQRSAYEKGVRPLLGLELDNEDPTSVPRVNTEILYRSLPSNQDMIRLFETHRLRCHPFHMITYNIDELQTKLSKLIISRYDSRQPDIRTQDLRWICLLHAIFAAGAQSSDLPLEQQISLSDRHSKFGLYCGVRTHELIKPSTECF